MNLPCWLCSQFTSTAGTPANQAVTTPALAHTFQDYKKSTEYFLIAIFSFKTTQISLNNDTQSNFV
jgi:hypothetical protein